MIGCWQSAGYMEQSSCAGSTDKDWRSVAQKRKRGSIATLGTSGLTSSKYIIKRKTATNK